MSFPVLSQSIVSGEKEWTVEKKKKKNQGIMQIHYGTIIDFLFKVRREYHRPLDYSAFLATETPFFFVIREWDLFAILL